MKGLSVCSLHGLFVWFVFRFVVCRLCFVLLRIRLFSFRFVLFVCLLFGFSIFTPLVPFPDHVFSPRSVAGCVVIERLMQGGPVCRVDRSERSTV